MLGILFPLVAGWLILTAFGLAVLAPIRRPGLRQVWLPAAPLLGAALTAVVLSATTWFVPVRWGVFAVIGVAIGCVVLALVRRSRCWVYSRGTVIVAVLCWAIGGIGAILALLPNLMVGDARVLSANSSHDAFYYAAESSWFTNHTMLPGPGIGAVPAIGALTPAFGPAVSSYYLPLRMGQPMVQSALTVLLRRDEITTTMPIIALWVLVLSGAIFVAGRMLRLRISTCFGLALASVTSAVLINQAYSQNADSLLGVGLAVCTIGAVLAATQGRTSRWPAALVLAGLVAVYVEYAAFVAPAVVGGVLLFGRNRLGRRIVRAAQILLLALVLAPTAWLRGISSILAAPTGGFDNVAFPFSSGGPWAVANHILGVQPYTEGTAPDVLIAVLGIAVAIGCVAAVAFDRNRGAWIGLLVVGLGYATLLTVQGKGYSQFRAVTLLIPLLLLACAAGWNSVLLRRRRQLRLRQDGRGRLSGRGWDDMLVWVLVPVLLLWVAVNVRTARAQLDPVFVASRHVDADYAGAAAWVAELGGTEGADVTVLVPDFFQQLWINFELRDDDEVSYPMLNTSYLKVSRYWAGEADRYLLVGPGVQVDADAATVVRSNSRFQLLDTQAGAVTVVAPADLTNWLPFAQAEGVFLGSTGSQLLVIRSPTAPTDLAIELATPLEPAPVSLELVEPNGDAIPATLTGTATPVPVIVATPSTTLTIEPGPDAVDIRPQIQLLGVTA